MRISKAARRVAMVVEAGVGVETAREDTVTARTTLITKEAASRTRDTITPATTTTRATATATRLPPWLLPLRHIHWPTTRPNMLRSTTVPTRMRHMEATRPTRKCMRNGTPPRPAVRPLHRGPRVLLRRLPRKQRPLRPLRQRHRRRHLRDLLGWAATGLSPPHRGFRKLTGAQRRSVLLREKREG